MFILLATAITAPWLRRSPSYEGKRLDFWINELGGKDWAKAKEALLEIGPDAVPALLAAHSSKASFLDKIVDTMRLHASDVIASKLPERPDRNAIRNYSLETLIALGPDARQGILKFQQAFRAPKRDVTEEFEATEWAEAMLAAAGKDDPALRSFFINSLSVTQWQVVCPAITALGEIGPPARAAVPKLIELLNHESGLYWRPAAVTLGQIGSVASNAVPALRKVMLGEEEDLDERVRAAEALWRISNETIQTLPVLMGALKGGGVFADCFAADALGEMGRAAEPALPALFEVLHPTHQSDSGALFKIKVAKAIWRISSKADVVLPALLDILHGAEQKAALEALGMLGSAARPAIPELVIALQAQDYEVRRSAAKVLGNVEPEATEAVPVLVKALRDDFISVRLNAAESLCKIDPQNDQLPPTLNGWLQTGGVRTRRCAAELRARMDRLNAGKASEKK